MARRTVKPEYPRSEPEIIPPSRDRTQPYGTDWYSGGRQGGGVFVAKFGTWKLLGIVLLIGVVAGAVLAILVGTLLIAIPLVGLLVACVVIAGQLRGSLRGPR
jgi:hypothetical protein